MARERVDVYLDDAVPTVDVHPLPAIPVGEVWRLRRFGGAAVNPATVALQITTDGTTWTTMRAIVAPDGDDFAIERDYVGDGTLRFRIVRQNSHTSEQSVVAWLEAYKRG